jgi:hypothetical protein
MISNRIFQRLENDDDRGFAPAESLQREETSQVRISDARPGQTRQPRHPTVYSFRPPPRYRLARRSSIRTALNIMYQDLNLSIRMADLLSIYLRRPDKRSLTVSLPDRSGGKVESREGTAASCVQLEGRSSEIEGVGDSIRHRIRCTRETPLGVNPFFECVLNTTWFNERRDCASQNDLPAHSCALAYSRS